MTREKVTDINKRHTEIVVITNHTYDQPCMRDRSHLRSSRQITRNYNEVFQPYSQSGVESLAVGKLGAHFRRRNTSLPPESGASFQVASVPPSLWLGEVRITPTRRVGDTTASQRLAPLPAEASALRRV